MAPLHATRLRTRFRLRAPWRWAADVDATDRTGGLVPCRRSVWFWLVPLAAVLGLPPGCSTASIESAHFGPSVAIEQAIRRHHERYASEGGGRCFRPSIDGFTELEVVEETPDRLVVHARYLYRDRFQEGGGSGQVCRGFGERTFTLQRDPDANLVVVDMTGEQDEPAIRSLIRRAWPG
jgi:hypothetical protein